MVSRVIHSFILYFAFSTASSYGISKTCPKPDILEQDLAKNSSDIFQQKSPKSSLDLIHKYISELRTSYKNSGCVLFQSYLGVMLSMQNVFVQSEKEQAKNFKKSKSLLERSVSKTKRSSDRISYLLSLKNLVKTYSFLPKTMINENTRGKESLKQAEALSAELSQDPKLKELLNQVDKSLKSSKDRLYR